MKPTINDIKNNYFFNEKTYCDYFTCYVIRTTRGNVRGWVFNGNLTEMWVPYYALKFTMKVYSRYRDIVDFINKTYRNLKFSLKKEI